MLKGFFGINMNGVCPEKTDSIAGGNSTQFFQTSPIGTNMQATKRFFQETWYPVTLGLFLFPVICLLLGTFGFLVGIPIMKWHAPIGFIVSVVCATYLCKFWHARAVIAGLISVILGTLLVVSSLTVELIEDGFNYHKPAMIALCEGWNPYWFPKQLIPDVKEGKNSLYGSSPWWMMWIECYPKATWIIGAELYVATGNVDQVHAINMLFVFVAVPICFVAIRTIFNISIFKSLLFSLILASNPVSLTQISSGCVDGTMGLCLTILFLSLAAYQQDRRSFWFPFIVGSIIIATNAKFTGVIYVGVFLLIALGAHFVIDRLHKKHFDKQFLSIIGIATILSLIVGINPYLQNLYQDRHPFHPIMLSKASKQAG